jgi:ketosteroid isomerase-like protein
MRRFGKNCSGWLAAACVGFGLAAEAADGIAADLSARWMSAYNGGDAKELAAMYAADAQVRHGYCAPVHGRDAIEAFWTNDLAAGGLTTELNVVDSFEHEGLVYLSGEYAVVDPSIEDAPIGGTFMQIWRRSGKGADWRLFRESWVNLACVRTPSENEPGEADDASPSGVEI